MVFGDEQASDKWQNVVVPATRIARDSRRIYQPTEIPAAFQSSHTRQRRLTTAASSARPSTVGSPGPRQLVDARAHHGVYTQSRASYFPQIQESLTSREGREQRARFVDAQALTARRPPSSSQSGRRGSLTARARLESSPASRERPETNDFCSVATKLDRDGIAAIFEAFQELTTLDEEEFVSEMLTGLRAHEAAADKRVELTGQLSDLFHQVDVRGRGLLTWEDFSVFISQTSDVASALEDTVINKYQADTVPSSLNFVAEVEGMFYLPDVDQIVIHDAKSRGIQVLDTITNRLRQPVAEPGRTPSHAAIVDAVYTPRGRYIITASSSPVLSFYDADKLRIRQQIPTPSFQTALALETSASLLYSAGVDGRVHAWDLDSLSCRDSFFDPNSSATIVDLELITTTTQLACGSLDGSIYMVDLTIGRPTRTLRGHTKGVAMLRYCAENKYLVSGGIDHKLQVWNPHLEHKIGSLPGHRSQLIGLAVRPDTPEVITADESGVVKIWDLRKFAAVQTIVKEMYVKGHHNAARGMTAMCYVESQQRIAIAHSTVFFMDPRRVNQAPENTPATVHANDDANDLLEEDAKPLAVRYHAASQCFLAVTPWTMLSWDARTGCCVRSSPISLGAQVTCTALLDSSCFVGCEDGSIAQLMLPTASVVIRSQVHASGDVRILRVASAQRLVLSSGENGNVIVSHWDTLEPLHSVNHWRGVHSVSSVTDADLSDAYSVPLPLRSFFIGNEIERLKAAFAVGDPSRSGKIPLSSLPSVLERVFPSSSHSASSTPSPSLETAARSAATLTFASFVGVVKDALAKSTNASGLGSHPLALVSSFDFHSKQNMLITASTRDDRFCVWDARNAAVIGDGAVPPPQQSTSTKPIGTVTFLSPLPLFVCVEEHSPQLSLWTTTAIPPSLLQPYQCLLRYTHLHVSTVLATDFRSRASTTFLTDTTRQQEAKASASPTSADSRVNIQSLAWFYSDVGAKRMLCVGDEAGGITLLDLKIVLRRLDDLQKPASHDRARSSITQPVHIGQGSQSEVFPSSLLQRLHRWTAYHQHGVGVRSLSVTEVENLLQPNANKHEIVASIGDNGAVQLWATDGQLLGRLQQEQPRSTWRLRLDEDEIQQRTQDSASTMLRQVEQRFSVAMNHDVRSQHSHSPRLSTHLMKPPRSLSVKSPEDALVAWRRSQNPVLVKPPPQLLKQRSTKFSSSARRVTTREEG